MADILGVSLSVVEQLRRRHRTTGEVAPKPPAGGQRPRLEAAAQAQVRRWVDDQPEATLAALGTRLATETSARASGPTLGRVRQRLGLPRTKRRVTPRHVTRRGSSRHERRPQGSSRPSTSSACGSSMSPASTWP